MKAMRIVTIACWAIAAIALAGLAVWFLTGSVFGIGSESRSFGLFSGFSGLSIGGWERLTGPYKPVGVYTQVDAGIDSLYIDWIAGDVTVKPYDGNEFQITEFAQRELRENEQLIISASNGTLKIQFRENGRVLLMPEKRLEVLVPRALSESFKSFTTDNTSGGVFIDRINAGVLKADTISGRISITSCRSETLDLSSTSGSVTVASVTTNYMSINNISGSIRVTESVAKTLDCDTTTGSHNISGSFDNARLNSISGRISLENGIGISTVTAESGSGSIDLSGAFSVVNTESISGSIKIKSDVVPDSLKVDTTSGGITVTVPDEGPITVNHSMISGRFSSDIAIIVKDGDARFSFSSISGSIRIIAG